MNSDPRHGELRRDVWRATMRQAPEDPTRGVWTSGPLLARWAGLDRFGARSPGFAKSGEPLEMRDPHGSSSVEEDEVVTGVEMGWDFDRLEDGETEGEGVPLTHPTWAALDTALHPPEGWETWTNCRDDIEGTSALCDTVESSLRVESDVWDLDVGEADESVKIVDATAEEEGLILRAWALLQANTDLIGWAVCWVTGKTTVGDELINALFRTANRVNIKVRDEGSAFHADPWLGVIKINRTRTWWRNDYLPTWAGDRTDRACAAVDLACTLLHELTHLVWRSYVFVQNEPCNCMTSYLIENALRWAIFRRYRFVLESPACAGSGNPCQFAYDGGVVLNNPDRQECETCG